MTRDPAPRVPGYTLLELLGQGGMGAVYRARDERVGRFVAIKLLAAELARDDDFRGRFEREARAAARVRHPNVIVIHELGTANGVPFAALELVTGGSLDARLAREGRLPWREVARLGARVASALAAVHAAGLVHRDVKPANVLLDERGEPRLADFGLVRRDVRSAPSRGPVTKSGEVLGTFEYLAPEQASEDAALDGRADLYALGATLHHLLTGAPPFRGAGIALLAKHVHEAPRSVRATCPEVPEALAAVVLRLLSKKPGDRGPGAHTLELELDALARAPEKDARSTRPLWLAGAVVVLVGVLLPLLGKTPPATPVSPELPTPAPRTSPSSTSIPLSTSPAPRADAALIASLTSGFRKTERTELARIAGSYGWRDAVDVDRVAFLPLSAVPARVPITSGAQVALSASRNGSLKLWEIPADAHAPAREAELATTPGRIAGAMVLAVSADGSRALAGYGDGRIRLWDLAAALRGEGDGACLATLIEGGREPASERTCAKAVAISPDGRRGAASDAGGRLHLWELESGQELGAPHVEDGVSAILFLPDGRLATSSSSESRVKIFELGALAKPLELPGVDHTIRALALLPDHQHLLAAGSDATLRLWDLAAPGPPETFEEHKGEVFGLAVSPDGAHVATSSQDRTVRVWETADLLARRHGASRLLGERRNDMLSVAFSPDGATVLACGIDHDLAAWELASGKAILPRGPGHASTIEALALQGSRLVSASRDGTARVWDWSPKGPVTPLATFAGHHAAVQCVAVAPDGARVLTGGADNFARLWTLATAQEEKQLDARHAAVTAVAYGSGHEVLTGDENGGVLRWSLEGNTAPTPLVGQMSAIRCLAFSARGRRTIVAEQDGPVLVVESGSGRSVRFAAAAKRDMLLAAALTGAGDRLIVATLSAGATIWNLEDRTFGAKIPLPGGDLPAGFAVSPDERTVVFCRASEVVLWDLAASREIDRLDLDSSGDRATAVAWSPDGKSFVVGTARGLLLGFDFSSRER